MNTPTRTDRPGRSLFDRFRGEHFNASDGVQLGGANVRELSWSPYEQPAEPAVMVVRDHRRPATVALQRAARAAAAMHARLHVVVAIASDDGEAGTSRARLGEHLGALAPDLLYTVYMDRGGFEEVAIARGRELRPLLVVVDSEVSPKSATAIADVLSVPVLVARPARRHGSIIAATDMRDLEYPVLLTARELGRQLRRPVTFFHNAKPLVYVPVSPLDAPVPFTTPSELDQTAAEAKLGRLRTLAAGDSGLDAVLARTHATLDAILEIARERDADIVTVGHRSRSWFGRLFGDRLPERLVASCRRSVLVVPIEEVR